MLPRGEIVADKQTGEEYNVKQWNGNYFSYATYIAKSENMYL